MSPRSQPSSLALLAQTIHWPTRVLGIVASIVSMHLLIVRPLMTRVDSLESEIHEFDSSLAVVAQRSTGHSSMQLSSQLETRHDDIVAARATLAQISLLNREMGVEADRLEHTQAALNRLKRIPSEVSKIEGMLTAALNEVQSTTDSPTDATTHDIAAEDRLRLFEDALKLPRPSLMSPHVDLNRTVQFSGEQWEVSVAPQSTTSTSIQNSNRGRTVGASMATTGRSRRACDPIIFGDFFPDK